MIAQQQPQSGWILDPTSRSQYRLRTGSSWGTQTAPYPTDGTMPLGTVPGSGNVLVDMFDVVRAKFRSA